MSIVLEREIDRYREEGCTIEACTCNELRRKFAFAFREVDRFVEEENLLKVLVKVVSLSFKSPSNLSFSLCPSRSPSIFLSLSVSTKYDRYFDVKANRVTKSTFVKNRTVFFISFFSKIFAQRELILKIYFRYKRNNLKIESFLFEKISFNESLRSIEILFTFFVTTLRGRFVLWRRLRKRKRRARVPLPSLSCKDFFFAERSELVIRCGRPRKEVSIPQKDILHMSDVNWLNTFPRENAGPLCVILRTFLHSREVLSYLAKYRPDVEILL